MSDDEALTIDRIPATPFERGIAQLVAGAVFLLLLLQILEASMFIDVTKAVTANFGFDRGNGFGRLNLTVHATIVLLAVVIPGFRSRLDRFRTVWLATLAYGAIVIGSTVLNVETLTAMRIVEAQLIPLTILSLGVCLPAILDLDDYDLLFRLVIAALLVSAVASLWLVVAQQPSVFGRRLAVPRDFRGGWLAAVGLYDNRNTIGSFLQFGPALIVYLAVRHGVGLQPRRIVWWLYFCALALISAHLLLTFSRSSQVVAAVSLLPVLPALRTRPRVAYAIGALLAAGIVVATTIPEFRSYIRLGATLSARESIWEGVLEQAVERPLFGFGLRNLEFREPGRRHTPHNSYLAQFAYFGLVGLTLFVLLLAAFGRLVVQNMRQARDRASPLLVMLAVGVLFQGILEYIVTLPVFFTNSMFWICVGLAARDWRLPAPALAQERGATGHDGR